MPARNNFEAQMSQDSGAFTVDGNIPTIAGYATMGGGVLLAAAIGTMVAPAPTLGLVTIGGGLTVAGNIKQIKEFFTPEVPEMAGNGEPDATLGGEVAHPDTLGDNAAVVTVA